MDSILISNSGERAFIHLIPEQKFVSVVVDFKLVAVCSLTSAIYLFKDYSCLSSFKPFL